MTDPLDGLDLDDDGKTVRLVWADEFGRNCVVARAGDTADEVIAWCRTHRATFGADPDGEGGDYVVRLRRDVGAEAVSEDRLRELLPLSGVEGTEVGGPTRERLAPMPTPPPAPSGSS